MAINKVEITTKNGIFDECRNVKCLECIDKKECCEEAMNAYTKYNPS